MSCNRIRNMLDGIRRREELERGEMLEGRKMKKGSRRENKMRGGKIRWKTEEVE